MSRPTDPVQPARAEDTVPATGLACTPGDYGFAVGATVGRYVVLERLGGGGMGVVYAAYDPKLDRKVALKLLRPDASGSAEAQERLLREAQTLARLAHPNVVNVHDVVEHEGRVVLAMELVRGSTLAAWLSAEARSRHAIVDAFLQAGRGLSAAHAVGIVHRDFKPDNVLVGDDGRVRVADFGIATFTEDGAPPSSAPRETDYPAVARKAGSGRDGATSSSVLGTPAYMAPEQLDGRAADSRSDQFSFCVALAEALTGQHPFEGKSLVSLAAADDASPSLPKGERLPGWLRPVLLRGLSVERGARYRSMNDLLRALARDPFAVRRGSVLGVGLVAVAAVAVLAYGRTRQQQSLLCKGGEERLSGVWDDAREQAASRAFAATGKPFAGAAFHGASGALDAYAQSWVSTYEDACAATNVRGEQSAELLDLRMACLEERKKELGALADVLANADGAVVTNAAAAARALTPVATCSDAKALRARTKPPADAATAARVDELRGELAKVQAMSSAGKYRDAAPLARDLAASADATGYAPLQGEASYADGVLRARTGDLPGAEASLYRALHAADAAGDDRTRVQVYGALIYYVGDAAAKRELIPIFREEARAALARGGGDALGEAQIAQTMGAVLLGEGKYDDALAEDQKALDLWRSLRGPESNEVARTLGNMGVAYEAAGRADEALDHHQRSLAIEEKVLGPDHPDLAKTWHNIGDVHLLKMEFADAADSFRRADEIAEAALGPDHPVVARCLDGLADAVIELGDTERAVSLHERALAIKEKALGPNNPVLLYSLLGLGEALVKEKDFARAVEVLERAKALPSTGNERDGAAVEFALARALTGAGKGGARAHDLALHAREVYATSATSPGERHNLDEVVAWLATH